MDYNLIGTIVLPVVVELKLKVILSKTKTIQNPNVSTYPKVAVRVLVHCTGT